MGRKKKNQKQDTVKFLGTFCPYCGSTNIGVVYKPQIIREVDYSFCYDCASFLKVDAEMNVIEMHPDKPVLQEV